MEDNTPKLPIGTIILLTYRGATNNGSTPEYQSGIIVEQPMSTKEVFESASEKSKELNAFISNIQYIYPPKA